MVRAHEAGSARYAARFFAPNMGPIGIRRPGQGRLLSPTAWPAGLTFRLLRASPEEPFLAVVPTAAEACLVLRSVAKPT
jgi:hypothetical protein